MFYLLLTVIYSFVGYGQFHEYFYDELMIMALDLLLMIAGISMGLYFLRAGSSGEKSLFALARSYKDLEEEDRIVFTGKFLTARSVLFTSGILVTIILGMAGSKGFLPRLASLPLSYQLTLMLPMPIILTMLLDLLLRIQLKVAAGRASGMKLETDGKLNALGIGLLGCFASLWIYPYNDPDACIMVTVSLLVCPFPAIIWRSFVSNSSSSSSDSDIQKPEEALK